MALKDLTPGTSIKLSELSNEAHATAPPSRFSEVSLVKKLSELDIGRPSTFSSIVSLIQDRGYVAKKGTQLYPTALGFAVARLLAAKLPAFTAYDYTAKMELELDEIAEWKQLRAKFLSAFWDGKDGFEALVSEISKDIDFKELEKYSRIDLYNGFSIRFTRFGTFLQDDKGEPDAKGYLPSARVDDDVDVWLYKDLEVCKEALAKAVNKVDSRELGVLETGEYAGWTVRAAEGRFGTYLQAMHPNHVKALAADKKPAASVPSPINHQLPEGLLVETVTLEEASPLFQEIKLPRWSKDKKWLVGVGKKGAYMGRKASPKGRPAFRSLPEELDPRTVEFSVVEELWAKAVAEAAAKAEAKATKAVAKKPAKKKTPAKPKLSK